MPGNNPVREMQEERKKQRQNALKKLDELAKQKHELQRPVFFVPGWTDESNVCWKSPYKEGYTPIKDWLSCLVENPDQADYVTFTEQQSKEAKSFFDFAGYLKDKIRRKISRHQKSDVVGHSMGGLDAVAAILDEGDPLLNVYNLVTVGTPHQGTEWGEIAPRIRNYPEHHKLQCINLDPDQLPIELINRIEKRKTLLNRIHKLYCLYGTRDMAVMRSAKYKKDGLNPDFYKQKVELVEVGGARHSQQLGITQDPRLILSVLCTLLDIKLERPQYNYGFIHRGLST